MWTMTCGYLAAIYSNIRLRLPTEYAISLLVTFEYLFVASHNLNSCVSHKGSTVYVTNVCVCPISFL